MSNKSAAILPPIRVRDVNSQVHGLVKTTVDWVGDYWLQLLVSIGVGTAIVLALHVARRLGRTLCERDGKLQGWGIVLGRAIARTGNVFMVLLAAKLVVGFANPPADVTRVINFLFTISAVFQAALWARELILGAIEHRTRNEHYSGEAIGSAMGIIRLLVSFAVFAIALIVVLDNLGVNVTGLVAGLGVSGIAIGLAAQGIFADLFAALAIIFDRPFRRGDAISYDKSSGTVEAIGLKSTRIRGVTGEERIVANKQLLEKEIINNSSRDYRRVIFTLGLVQWTPIETMEALPSMLKDVIEANGMKFVRAGFTTFGTNSYDFDVEFDSPSAAFQDFYDARHTVGMAIVRMLNTDGIELAYPTQTTLAGPGADGSGLPPTATKPPSSEQRKGTGAAASRSAVDEDAAHN
ncbi:MULTISPECIES: mechanosensitive ion channel family protein [unclassified Sphingomonas]|uniref:mechanosensitive ion channel family protein n=1 Tax=unclassified Sphingomonas TaxID=196159 RepID=UPI001F5AFBBA|nr:MULTISPECIES: mechanosensitive ion channel family protein [unclassified Sphingomonas]